MIHQEHQNKVTHADTSSGYLLPTIFLVLIDVGLVIIFATLGNRSHDSGLGLGDVAATAWPFVVGLVIGSLITRAWNRPSRLWPDGVMVLAITVALGMLLRVMFTDGGTQLSFILVASGTLGALLLGRRVLSGLLLPRIFHQEHS